MSDLLNIDNLSVEFHTPEGVARAVENVSITIKPGESIGLVGESGCGKSVTAMSVLRLIPSPPSRVGSGRILFNGTDLLEVSDEEMRRIRGARISMIFQEPMTSLNPVLTIGRQVAEPLMIHLGLSKARAYDRAAELLDRVKIPAARQRLEDFPHHLSGGMRQRVMIAMALACQPQLLIADEPTTALDVTIQAQILSLIARMKEEVGAAVLLITHDLGVVAQTTSRVVVMYAGQVVEQAPVKDLFNRPIHPYTRGLLESMPALGTRAKGKRRLTEIKGLVPALTDRIEGCKFAERCGSAFDLCRQKQPRLMTAGQDRSARCWLVEHPDLRRANPGQGAA